MSSERNFFVRRRIDLICIAVILLAAVIFFFPVWWQGKTFYAFDTLNNFYPWLQKVKINNHLLTDPINAPYPGGLFLSNTFFHNNFTSIFNLPMWNDTFFCGIPFYSYYTTPFRVMYYGLIPPVKAHDIFLFLHLAANGIFCFLYIRNLRRKNLSSLLGAILWMFNGYIMCWFEFESFLLLAATLPAGLLCIDRWWRKPGAVNWLMMSLVFCWGISSGYAHLFMLQMLFFGIYVLYRILLTKKKRLVIKKSAGILLAVFVCFMSGLNFFLEHYEMYSDSTRTPYSFDQLFQKTGRVPARLLPQMIFPFLFGSPTETFNFIPRDSKTQVYNNFSEMCLYCGIPVLFLFLASLFGLKKYRVLRFFFISSIVILLMVMGTYLYYPLYQLVPGLKLTTASRLLQLFGFSVVVCSAFGLDIIVRNLPSPRKTILTILFAALTTLILFIPWWATTSNGVNTIFNNPGHLKEYLEFAEKFYSYTSPRIFVPLTFTAITLLACLAIIYFRRKQLKMIFCGVLICSALAELMIFGWSYNTAVTTDRTFPSTPGINYLVNQAKPFRIMMLGRFYLNGFVPYGLEDIGGYSSSISSRYRQYANACQKYKNKPDFMRRALFFNSAQSPMIDLLNTKYLITGPLQQPIKDKKFKLIYNKEMAISENTQAFPRAFMVPETIYAASADQALQIISKMSHDDFSKQVVLESQETALNRSQLPPFSAKVEITGYKPDKLELTADSNASGYLVVSNSYHSGWKCIVNNKPTKVLRANYIMQTVKLPKGHSKVMLQFKPVLPVVFFSISSTIQLALVLFLLYYLLIIMLQKGTNKANGYL